MIRSVAVSDAIKGYLCWAMQYVFGCTINRAEFGNVCDLLCFSLVVKLLLRVWKVRSWDLGSCHIALGFFSFEQYQHRKSV
jgi:hypothetical protein